MGQLGDGTFASVLSSPSVNTVVPATVLPPSGTQAAPSSGAASTSNSGGGTSSPSSGSGGGSSSNTAAIVGGTFSGVLAGGRCALLMHLLMPALDAFVSGGAQGCISSYPSHPFVLLQWRCWGWRLWDGIGAGSPALRRGKCLRCSPRTPQSLRQVSLAAHSLPAASLPQA